MKTIKINCTGSIGGRCGFEKCPMNKDTGDGPMCGLWMIDDDIPCNTTITINIDDSTAQFGRINLDGKEII